MTPTWTILIPTLGQRRDLLSRLLDGLMPQVDAQDGNVQVLAYWDCGEVTLADKKQSLVEACTTDYLCFVDDDDTVSDDYVKSIVDALTTEPDYVGLKMMVYKDGREYGLSHHSLIHGGWHNTPSMFLRDITCANPMRTSIAATANFRLADGTNTPEDRVWTSQLRAGRQLKTEVFIDRVIYHYWWETEQSAWGRNRESRITRTDPTGQPWQPLAVDSAHFTYHPASPIGDRRHTGMNELITWFRALLDEDEQAFRYKEAADEYGAWWPAEIADVRAKRAILDRWEGLRREVADNRDDPDAQPVGTEYAYEQVVKTLASAYADRPDYRPEWAADILPLGDTNG